MKKWGLAFMVLLLLLAFAGTSFAAHQISQWPDNKAGAVSLTFDDGCISHLNLGIPALNARGLKGTFYIITGNIDSFDIWESWRDAASMGHEIGSHTKTHPQLPTLSPTEMRDEIVGSRDVINGQITQQKCLTFAYPYGQLNSDAEAIVQSSYIAGRGVLCDEINSPPYDFYNLMACPAENYSPSYWLEPIKSRTNSAEQQGKWFILLVHSLDGGNDCYGYLQIADFTAYLDYLTTKDVWVGTVSSAVKYIKERDSATLSVVSSTSDQIVLSLTDTLDNATFDQPLTIRSEVSSGWARVPVRQGSSTIEVTPVVEETATVVYYNAVPDRGNITLANAAPSSQPPVISSLSPSYANVGGLTFPLAVNGSNFVTGSTVRWNGSGRTTSFVSTTQLTATITASDISVAGTASVSVLNPNGDFSNSMNFEIRNPLPSLTSLSPSSAIAGGTGFTLTVNGANFISTSEVRWNNSGRQTSFVSNTQVQAAITAADIATAGTASVTVFNSSPGGGLSNALAFAINNPPPTIVLNPMNLAFSGIQGGANPGNKTVALSNGGGGTLSWTAVVGSGSPAWLSVSPGSGTGPGTLTVSVDTAGLSAGSYSRAMTVTATGATNSPQTLNVTLTISPAEPPPKIVLNPTSLTFNAVVGTNPGNQGVALSNGGGGTLSWTAVVGSGSPAWLSASPGSGTGPGTLTVSVSTAGLSAGSYSKAITVTASDASNSPQTLNVTLAVTNPIPTATGLSPSSATAGGGGFTLTVNGSNFINGSVVKWNGVDRTTTFSSSTQLSAAIPAGDITVAGTPSVTVFNPTPGGGVSAAQTFTVNNPVPTISGLSPSSVIAGGVAFTLTVNGTNFVNGSVVQWNGSNRTTTYVSSTQVTAAISAADIGAAGAVSVTVYNPTPGGGTSAAASFNITANNPVPVLTSISLSSATAGSGGFTLTVNGSNFINGSVVRWGGSDRLTTFVSATRLKAAIGVADIAVGGTMSVTVFNPTPGGGVSGAQTFTVKNPSPAITSLSPSSATAGDPGITLTVNGTNFVGGSVVRWKGSDRTTTYVSATQVTALISAADIAAAGTANVKVFNPSPGGGLSGAQTFTVNNPVPTIRGLSPSSAIAGGAAFSLTVNGTNFVSGSVVRWKGSNRTTTYISATQVKASITQADIGTAGTAAVTVYNATPGGGTSSAVNFPINAHVIGINSGGKAARAYIADTYFTGGTTSSTNQSIDLSGVLTPAPMSIYQNGRYGNFQYSIPNLAVGQSYKVVLHFAEYNKNAAGQRSFNVVINGTQVLTNFDIFATAGGQYKAIVQSFTVTANSNGKINITFSNVVDQAIVQGVEVLNL